MLPIIAAAGIGAAGSVGSSLVSNAMKFGHQFYQNQLVKDYLQFSNAQQLEFNRKNFEQGLQLMSKHGINPALAGGQFSTG